MASYHCTALSVLEENKHAFFSVLPKAFLLQQIDGKMCVSPVKLKCFQHLNVPNNSFQNVSIHVVETLVLYLVKLKKIMLSNTIL